MIHPDPEITVEINEDMRLAEIADVRAGYGPRIWTCPDCGASHDRGWFPTEGSHRCLRCGYVGPGGTLELVT